MWPRRRHRGRHRKLPPAPNEVRLDELLPTTLDDEIERALVQQTLDEVRHRF